MRKILIILICIGLFGCGAKDAIDKALDVVNVERKPIDVSITGVNAFANDPRFGSIGTQFREVKNTLGLKFVRVIFAWNDGVQPSPSVTPNFSFDEDILQGVPSGVDVLAVVGGLPSWMSNSANWIDGNPRKTFVEKFMKPLAQHFAGNGKLIGFEVWNEPNMLTNHDNAILGIDTDPVKFTELVSLSAAAIHAVAPGKKVLNGATTAINQNFPDTLSYNKSMVDSGMLEAVDHFAVHYYGEQFERVVVGDGVADFLNGLGRTIWVTESGAQGINNQLEYVEKAWPFLKEKIPSIARFYYYQFTEDSSPDVTYGLKNTSSSTPLSDLYVFLRDRK